jgi:hypothetical protein
MTRYFSKKKPTLDEIASRDATMRFVDEYLQELCRLSGAQVRSLQQGGISEPRDMADLTKEQLDAIIQPPLTSERHRAKLARVHTYVQGRHLLVPGKTKFNHILVMVGDDTGELDDETTTNYWQADDPYNVNETYGVASNIELFDLQDEDAAMDGDYDTEQARRGGKQNKSKSRKHKKGQKRKSSKDHDGGGFTTDDSDSYEVDMDAGIDDESSPTCKSRTVVMAGVALCLGIGVGAVAARWVLL